MLNDICRDAFWQWLTTDYIRKSLQKYLPSVHTKQMLNFHLPIGRNEKLPNNDCVWLLNLIVC